MFQDHFETRADRADDSPRLIVISAGTEAELTAEMEWVRAHLNDPSRVLGDLALISQAGSSRSLHRIALAGGSLGDLRAAFADPARQHKAKVDSDTRPRLVFLFPGGGVQYPGMGRELYRYEPAYRDAVDTCRALLRDLGAQDVLPAFLASPENRTVAEELHSPSRSGVCIFVHQYAMFRLLESFGLAADEVIGHSLGEYACAVAAGALPLDDALKLMHARGVLLEGLSEPGAMLLVGESEGALASFMHGGTAIVALNGPYSTGVAGPVAAIDALTERLAGQGISNHRIRYGAASHCYLVKPLLPEFWATLATCTFGPPRTPWTSTVTARRQPPGVAVGASYWCRQFREPVRFAEAIRAVADEGPATFVEVGPHNGLTNLVRTIVAGANVVCFGQHANDARDARLVMLAGMGDLWSQGADIAWGASHPDGMPHRDPLAGSACDQPAHGRPLPDGPLGGSAAHECVGLGDRQAAERRGTPLQATQARDARPCAPADMRPPSERPPTDVEFVVGSIWREMFGNERIGLTDNFFDLGGHSLLAVRISSELQSLFRIELPPGTQFQNPTVQGVADAVVIAGRAHGVDVEVIATTLRGVSEMSDEHLASLEREALGQFR